MKTDTYLCMESLVNCGRKPGVELPEARQGEPVLCTVKPVDYDSWYCRTHVYTCPEGKEEAVAQKLAEDIRSKKLPWLLSVIVEDVSETFLAELEKAGFAVRTPQAGMLLETADYEVKPEDPHIVRIGEDRIEEWMDACTKGFGKPNEIGVMKKLAAEPSCKFYAYEEEGQIVGTLMMSYQPDNAGLHEVATLSEYRGHGICKALLNRAFIDARADGYEMMSLQASVFGEPVYRSIGMRKVCHIRTYKLADDRG